MPVQCVLTCLHSVHHVPSCFICSFFLFCTGLHFTLADSCFLYIIINSCTLYFYYNLLFIKNKYAFDYFLGGKNRKQTNCLIFQQFFAQMLAAVNITSCFIKKLPDHNKKRRKRRLNKTFDNNKSFNIRLSEKQCYSSLLLPRLFGSR